MELTPIAKLMMLVSSKIENPKNPYLKFTRDDRHSTNDTGSIEASVKELKKEIE